MLGIVRERSRECALCPLMLGKTRNAVQTPGNPGYERYKKGEIGEFRCTLPGISSKVVISSVPESVPEPKTSVMMITALGLLGLAGGRRGPDRNRKTCFSC